MNASKGRPLRMKPAKKGLVSIVILNWNGKSYLQQCIASLWKNTNYKNFEIIVSDNGSTDGSIAVLQGLKRRGKVHKLVLNEKNLGFGGGNNIGIMAAEGDYIFLLNNDTRATKDWLLPLVEQAKKDESIGIIGPWFPDADHKETIFGPGFVDNKGISRNAFIKEGEGEMVSGGAFFIKRKAVDKIGLFDERFFPIYFEDADYCARARKAGFKIWFTPKSKIIHFESAATSSQPSRWRFVTINSNRIRNALLHFPKRRLAKFLGWEALRLAKSVKEKNPHWLLKAWAINLKALPEIASKRQEYGKGNLFLGEKQ